MSSLHAKEISEAHRRAKHNAALAVGWAVIAGAVLQRVKADFSHGENNLKEWLSAECPEISLPTAYRYIALAKAMKKAESKRLRSLLCGEFIEAKEQAEILALVTKVTDGATITELYEEYGIVKRAPGTAATGGYKVDEARVQVFLRGYHPELEGTRYADLPEDIQAEFRTWFANGDSQEEQLALDFWQPLFSRYVGKDARETFLKLPKSERTRTVEWARMLIRWDESAK